MSDHISNTFNMRTLNEALSEIKNNKEEDSNNSEILEYNNDQFIEHEFEMNEIYKTAIKHHEDLIDLGFNMESKNSGTAFDPAVRMLEVALKASQSKIEYKTKLYKLQLDKEKLDNKKQDGVVETINDENSKIYNRAELLSIIKDAKEQK